MITIRSSFSFAKLFVVSEVKLSNAKDIKVSHHEGHKCDRCWNYSNDATTEEDGTHLCHRCKEIVK